MDHIDILYTTTTAKNEENPVWIDYLYIIFFLPKRYLSDSDHVVLRFFLVLCACVCVCTVNVKYGYLWKTKTIHYIDVFPVVPVSQCRYYTESNSFIHSDHHHAYKKFWKWIHLVEFFHLSFFFWIVHKDFYSVQYFNIRDLCKIWLILFPMMISDKKSIKIFCEIIF